MIDSLHWRSSKSEPEHLFELQCSCQSARPLALRHPGDHDKDEDDDSGDDNDEDDDDLDMHPETGHDSIASAQTSYRKLGLGCIDGDGSGYIFDDELLLMIVMPLPGLSYVRCRAHRPKQSAPDQA